MKCFFFWTVSSSYCWKLIFFKFIFYLIFFTDEISARKLPDIFWNSTNPMFDMSNTDHVKTVKILDRVTIICPLPSDNRPYEYSKLFMVSREDYENCELHSNQLVGSCVTPERHSSISLVFRDFSPLPSAFEFKPGQSYFIISTSNGTKSGLDNRVGGLCSRRQMRMRFDILPDDTIRNPSEEELSKYPGKHPIESTGVDSPLMYIIHTVGPETMPSAAQNYDKNEPDEASQSRISFFLIVASFLLTLNFHFRL
jgi:hypothetical protein